MQNVQLEMIWGYENYLIPDKEFLPQTEQGGLQILFFNVSNTFCDPPKVDMAHWWIPTHRLINTVLKQWG